jgi:hypothetical protein
LNLFNKERTKMTLALTYICERNFRCYTGHEGCLKSYPCLDKVFLPTVVLLDVALLITGFVVGALILSGNLSLPPAAAYASFGVGGTVLVLNTAAIIHEKSSKRVSYERVA